ncbi:MAG: signal peptidase II [Acidimicrobiales bacterium]
MTSGLIDAQGTKLLRLGLLRSLALATFATLALDQLTKWWALENLKTGKVSLGGPVRLFLTSNKGVAFSIGAGSRAVIVVVVASVLLLALILQLKWTTATPRTRLASGMLAGGAMGNIADRLGRGAVVDFIQVYYFSVFNIADVAIVIGAGLLIFVLIRHEIPEKVTTKY